MLNLTLLLKISDQLRHKTRNQLTVILCPGIGLADSGDQETLSAQMIPIDLRMPNSEFDVLFDRASGCFVKILRKGENRPEAD